jgi:feruloyl esterase
MASSINAQTQALPNRSPEQRCRDLILYNRLTLIYADTRPASTQGPEHCYVKGLIGGSITFHVQLPAPDDWNGRLVHRGDGGGDGDLDFSDDLVARGYAVVNSNTGHDVGATGGEWAYRNNRAEEDYAYRAVHFPTNAAKTVVEAYYGKSQEFAYHFGCSGGGRQGLAAAQLFPYDFDGIVAGAPGHRGIERGVYRLSTQKRLFADDFAANLAFDADKDGSQESLAKVQLLASAVMSRCDAADGIKDGIVEPPFCRFDPRSDLPVCQNGTDAETCFTPEQIKSIEGIYDGARNSANELVYPGVAPGTESQWPRIFVPHVGNKFVSHALRAGSSLAYYFYRDDPGLLQPDLTDMNYKLAKDAALPEWAWWEFDTDEFGSDEMSDFVKISRGNDADLDRFLIRQGGKLLMYHDWADGIIPPTPTLDYHADVISTVFDGDAKAAAGQMRLFMAPGMNHCRGGVGPNEADYLTALDKWVTDGTAPDTIVARHRTNGTVDNERPLCPYPERAVYTGPQEGINDPSNWIAENFQCR